MSTAAFSGTDWAVTSSIPQEPHEPGKSNSGSCLIVLALLSLIPALFLGVSCFVVWAIFSDWGMLHTMSSRRLDRLALEIEAFHQTTGEYPETLKHLGLPGNEIYDVTRGLLTSGPEGNYYYRRSEDGQHHDVLGVGWDGQPFTDDDIVPDPSP
jgi:hypothetical protein